MNYTVLTICSVFLMKSLEEISQTMLANSKTRQKLEIIFWAGTVDCGDREMGGGLWRGGTGNCCQDERINKSKLSNKKEYFENVP